MLLLPRLPSMYYTNYTYVPLKRSLNYRILRTLSNFSLYSLSEYLLLKLLFIKPLYRSLSIFTIVTSIFESSKSPNTFNKFVLFFKINTQFLCSYRIFDVLPHLPCYDGFSSLIQLNELRKIESIEEFVQDIKDTSVVVHLSRFIYNRVSLLSGSLILSFLYR